MNNRSSSDCRVCGGASAFAFTQKIFGAGVAYFDCRHCGYVQTQTPDWLDQAYSVPIHELDTGIMWRNCQNASRVVTTLATLQLLHGRVLDNAGGYGILVRLLRDVGVEAHWTDKYCENVLSRGFEVDDEPYDLVTAFEVFEHLENPVEELQRMLARSPHALISTDLIRTPSTPAPDWWYYGPEHGQHIGFFRTRTLFRMAKQLNIHCDTDGHSLHLFSRKPIPFWWRHLQRVPKAAALIARRRLRSKVWSDFETVRDRVRSMPK